MTWIKNTGQYHPMVAYVSPDARETGSYKGTGPVVLTHQDGQWSWDYHPLWLGDYDALPDWWKGADPTPAEIESRLGGMCAVASCGEIVVDHGTAAAAAINVLGGYSNG